MSDTTPFHEVINVGIFGALDEPLDMTYRKLSNGVTHLLEVNMLPLQHEAIVEGQLGRQLQKETN